MRTARFPGRPLMVPIQLVVLPQAIVIDGGHGNALRPRPGDREDGVGVHEPPSRMRSAVTVDNRIWVLTSSATKPVDELLALDPDIRRAVARIGLPTGGGVALQAVGSDLWVTDQER